MSKRIGMEIALAVAEAAALCRPDVIAAYPITPNTHIPEHLAEIVAEGHLDCEYLPVESEHSALSACTGASAAGARVYTATSSQGLLYMYEIIPIVPAMRLPVIMALGNRAISGPINIWNDHSDVMCVRDLGWISMFAANGQEAVDMTIQAFKIGEHHDVMLPVLVNLDGFQLTHVVESMIMPDQEEVDKFLPPRKPYGAVHPDNIVSMGTLALPEIYTEARMAMNEALINSKKIILEIWKEWEKMFGRKYEPISSYKANDADVVMLTMGSMGETGSIAVDQLREEGFRAGMLNMKLFRPFPADELRAAVKGATVLIVTDRAIMCGGDVAPVCAEVKAALYDEPVRPVIVNEIIGLGGRDVRVEDFVKIFKKAATADKVKPERAYEIYGVRAS
jgi:pyruvate ferredoxin oxidoreductase alpha subunit